MREQALWLTEHQPGTTYAQAGLIALARLADTAVEQGQADDAGRARLRSEALDAYRSLARALGDDPETLKNNRNALVASTRLASYAQELGRFDRGVPDVGEGPLRLSPRCRLPADKAGLANASAGELEWRSNAGESSWPVCPGARRNGSRRNTSNSTAWPAWIGPAPRGIRPAQAPLPRPRTGPLARRIPEAGNAARRT